MDAVMIKLFNMSITAVWLILAVVLMRFLLRKAPKYINLILWAFVGVRLVCPFTFDSVLSLIPTAETIPSNIQASSSPSVNTGINAVNEIVNPAISVLAEKPYSIGYSPIDMLLSVSFAVWVTGVVILLAYSLVSFILLKRRVSASVRYSDNIFLCDNIKTPFILGVFRPRIYLPSDINANQTASVIAHEKAHLKRLDHIWKPLGFLILSVHWFNPFVWLSYSLFCRDIELACDERVIRSMEAAEKKAYSQTLLSLSTHKHHLAACPLAFGEVGVKSRIKSVLSYKKPALWIIIASVLALIAIAVGFLTNPVNSQINSRVYKSQLFYHDEVIGAERANNEDMGRRFYISEDFVLSMYYDDGLNYQINQQGILIKQENYNSEIISLILDKLPSRYNQDKIKEAYFAESLNQLTMPKDLYVLLKFTNGDLIMSYLPYGNNGYYAMEVLKIKPLVSKTQLHSLSHITGTKGSTDCEGVTVKIIEALYFAENPYIKVQWENNTGKDFVYGEMFRLYKYENETKTPVDITIDNLAWNSIAYISKAKTDEKVFGLKYFDLSEPGIYTLEFEFWIGNDTQTSYTAVLEFEIADTPSTEPVSTSVPSVPESPDITVTEQTTHAVTVDNGENVNHSFTAEVLEVNEKNILVKPLEGEDELKSADRIYVSLDLISTNPLPDLKKGDKVEIVYNGEIQESYPAQINNVFAIYLY